ncbi:MAG: hypothetical protein JWM80_5933 [Cyanobacteria bacterium RYN_339]|nr:hypothetical protein [Cyanobacteria bacterium RYN_339]
MPNITDDEDFIRLVMALKPQISKVVFVGGWAHRLYPYKEG